MNNKVAELQARLNELGYGPLTVDGQYGKNTEAAYKAYLDAIDSTTPTFQPPAETKWWQSKAFIGAGATILVSVIGIFGFELDSELLTQNIIAIITLSTGVMSLVGTIKKKGAIDTVNINPLKRMRPVQTRSELEGSSEDPRGLFKDI